MIGGDTAGKDHNLALIAAEAAWGHGADPAFLAHEGPIAAWARAVLEKHLPHKLLHAMVRRARVTLVKAKRPWAVVKGPATAVIATAARIGWAFIDAVTAYTDRGREVQLLKDSPAMVVRLVRESVKRWRWRKVHGGEVGGEQQEVVWQLVAEVIKSAVWLGG